MSEPDWRTLPSLTALRAFEATARTGGFSAAARGLNVTHAAVAQQVRGLEAFMGLALVRRAPQGMSLTPEGAALAERLSRSFAEIAAAVEDARAAQAKRPIRITTTDFFADAVILPRIAEFWRAHPGTEVSYHASDAPVDLVAEGFDLAVRACDGEWEGLDLRLLLESPTRAFAAPSLVDDPDTDWSALPWLIPDDSAWQRNALMESGIDPDAIPTLDVGNSVSEIRAGEQGLGLVLESEIDVRPQLELGTLKRAPVDVRHISRYYTCIPPWPPRPQVKTFLDWLHRICAEPS